MKNSWTAGEVGTRSKMNQPFFVQSGTVSGGNLSLQIGPGRVRFPYQGLPVNFTGAQALVLTSVPVSTFYSLFLTAAGAVLASGHSSLSLMPDSPRVNGEYIGTVFTGNPVSTANLVGPWNMAASGYHETRGEYAAITPTRPRVMDQQMLVATLAQAIGCDVVVPYGDTAGVGGTTIDSVAVQEPAGAVSLVSATVQWMPSGALASPGYLLPSGTLRMAPRFVVRRTPSVTTVDHMLVASRNYITPQNPDQVGQQTLETTAFSYVTRSGSADALATYLLAAEFDSRFTEANAAPSIRVTSYTLVIEPGKKRSFT